MNHHHLSKMKTHFQFLITFLVICFLCKPSAGGGRVLSGGWNPIPDVTDPTVVSIGKFAVDESNKESLTSLNFRKIVKGDQQVVEGMKYNLTITAAYGGNENNYVALVWVKPWEKFKQLLSFIGPV
ncbi:putative Cystatin domain-containing protein [Helianthus annuus]|nr:putative Cystatin domain-containing protein [Helianthus annuus]